jgi:hypothetical protein
MFCKLHFHPRPELAFCQASSVSTSEIVKKHFRRFHADIVSRVEDRVWAVPSSFKTKLVIGEERMQVGPSRVVTKKKSSDMCREVVLEVRKKFIAVGAKVGRGGWRCIKGHFARV